MLHRTAPLAALVTTVIGAAVLGPAAPATAAWAVIAPGPAVAGAGAMPQGPVPAVSASGPPGARIFTVRWPTSQVGGRPATGYVLTRTSTLLGAGLISGGTCSGLTLAGQSDGVYVAAAPAGPEQSCTDVSGVSLGTVSYTVTPVLGQWLGSPSAGSAPVS